MVILYAQDVEGDLDSLADYIATDNPRRAVSLIREIYAEIERIGKGPLLYQLRPDIGPDARLAVVGRYVVLFRTAGDVVYIERVVYGVRGASSAVQPVGASSMATELQLHNPQTPSLPSIFTARPEARTRLRDFFSSHIRNPNTRRAYREAVRQFSAFCAFHGVAELAEVEPVHVAAFVEAQLKVNSKPTVKVRLAALRMLFDWMVVGQIVPPIPLTPFEAQSTRSGAARHPSSRPTRPAL